MIVITGGVSGLGKALGSRIKGQELPWLPTRVGEPAPRTQRLPCLGDLGLIVRLCRHRPLPLYRYAKRNPPHSVVVVQRIMLGESVVP